MRSRSPQPPWLISSRLGIILMRRGSKERNVTSDGPTVLAADERQLKLAPLASAHPLAAEAGVRPRHTLSTATLVLALL